jgi:glycogen operon protein
VNYIAVHDGFTLADFTAFAHKHNLANGEGNRDGRDDEVAAVVPEAVRARVRRSLLATLLLAQGTPMLLAGDEFGNSQGGNNNAYNQDNPTSWLDWASADRELMAFVQAVIFLRKSEPALRHGHWFAHAPAPAGERSIVWLAPSGHDMQVHDWHDGAQHAFACRIDASPKNGSTEGGCKHLLIAFNPEDAAIAFTLPPGDWQIALDSSDELPAVRPHKPLGVPAHSLIVLRDLTP